VGDGSSCFARAQYRGGVGRPVVAVDGPSGVVAIRQDADGSTAIGCDAQTIEVLVGPGNGEVPDAGLRPCRGVDEPQVAVAAALDRVHGPTAQSICRCGRACRQCQRTSGKQTGDDGAARQKCQSLPAAAPAFTGPWPATGGKPGWPVYMSLICTDGGTCRPAAESVSAVSQLLHPF